MKRETIEIILIACVLIIAFPIAVIPTDIMTNQNAMYNGKIEENLSDYESCMSFTTLIVAEQCFADKLDHSFINNTKEEFDIWNKYQAQKFIDESFGRKWVLSYALIYLLVIVIIEFIVYLIYTGICEAIDEIKSKAVKNYKEYRENWEQ